MIILTFSFLWSLAHGTNALLIEVALFFLRLAFLVKVVKQIGTELINKGKGKEERNKIHSKGKESGCSKLNFFQRLKVTVSE